ncbi:MAG: hypothetical protein ACREIA_10665, partial [Opitutaceae bacterium]
LKELIDKAKENPTDELADQSKDEAAKWTNEDDDDITFNPRTEWNGIVFVEMENTTNGAVRLINGDVIPTLVDSIERPDQNEGFTLATNVPAYIWGNYNADGNVPNDATDVRAPDSEDEPPAAVVADAISILSEAWQDGNSNKGLSNRKATETEVSAAIVTGIVPTNFLNNGTYSGGVENLPRFLENWGGVKFGYRGSMAVLYQSEIALEPWGSSNVYSPPNRVWGFNTIFEADPARFPPGRLISRSYRRLAYRSLSRVDYENRLVALGLH